MHLSELLSDRKANHVEEDRTSPSKLNVVLQHGPCSSSTRQYKPSHVDLFRQDQARVEYIHHQAANTTARLNIIGHSLFVGVPTFAGYSVGLFTYIINIGLGTPTKYFTVMFDTGPDKVGYLELGSPARGVTYTPMLTNPILPSFYFVNLIAIFIGGERLDISPTIFNSPGTILDSGTPFSRLPPTTYFALRSIFRKKMSNYLMAPPLFNLDTCYDLTNIEQVVVPNISFVYEGEVTTNLDISGILFQASDYQWCLSIVGSRDNSELIIIGSMQQRRFNVVFDVGNSQIGFGINGCS
ncbi:aspartyl protease family protein At5g10770-like [Dendrobium catenatum]|uniref:aspartyl protease family protein At5g10770-like n=1 Tax=Dendrobium catenatum TaxID=906689 RepID=UPI00109F44E1|nr:aspartyl protease family protein At5g10770-like [Dendrobium catenatum]